MKKEKIKQLKIIIFELERFSRINDYDIPTVVETLKSAIPKHPRAKDTREKREDYMEKQKGIVTWFNDAKGYGYIQQEDKREPVFVHYSAIVCEGFKTLTEGEVVYFEPHQTKSGMSALNVTRTKDTREMRTK